MVHDICLWVAENTLKIYRLMFVCRWKSTHPGNYLDRMVSENDSDHQKIGLKIGSKSERSLHACIVCSSGKFDAFICLFRHFVYGSISFLHFWNNGPLDLSSFIIKSNQSCAVKSARLMSEGCDIFELSNSWDGHGNLIFRTL